jgi:deoxyribose-phosphate aldolase
MCADLRRVVEAAAPVPAKVILETHYLNEEQICRVCDIAVEVGMKWVKTSTGWALPVRPGKGQHHRRTAERLHRHQRRGEFAIWIPCASSTAGVRRFGMSLGG